MLPYHEERLSKLKAHEPTTSVFNSIGKRIYKLKAELRIVID
jgi:hypothetical protein